MKANPYERRRIHITIPSWLIDEYDTVCGYGNRSRAAEYGLKEIIKKVKKERQELQGGLNGKIITSVECD